jgi:hypothetical protein
VSFVVVMGPQRWGRSFVAETLACPPIHPASRCSQPWGAVVAVGRLSAALCQDTAVASWYSVSVGLGGVSVDGADCGVCRVHTYPTPGSPGIPLHPLTLIDTLTSHLDWRRG